MTMISTATVTAFVVAVFFTTVVPVALLIVLAVMRRISGLPLLFGALAFFISQIIIRIPLLGLLSGQGWFQGFMAQTVVYVLFLSLTAGLFEESARLGGALILKKRRSFKDAVSFGLGHGFCEVIVLIGLSHINNLVLCFIFNFADPATLALLPEESLAPLREVFVTLDPTIVYWGILERVSAVLFHIFATILVFYAVRSRKWQFYLLAILAHAAFNSVAVFLAQLAGAAVSELALLVLALLAGFCALRFSPRFGSVSGQPAADGAALPGAGASGFSHVDANPPVAEQRVAGADERLAGAGLSADGQQVVGVPTGQQEPEVPTEPAGHGSPSADSTETNG
jgi:uncharacterized membrane protein YhfC